jgi:hypothetical protein
VSTREDVKQRERDYREIIEKREREGEGEGEGN